MGKRKGHWRRHFARVQIVIPMDFTLVIRPENCTSCDGNVELNTYEPYDDKIECLLKSPKAWNPIVAPFSKEEEIADGWHRTLAAKKMGAKTISAWIPKENHETPDHTHAPTSHLD
jgi:hypothetical protein